MDNIKAFVNVLKKLNYILNKKQKRKSIPCLLLIILNGIFETLGVAVIVPFLQALLMPEVLRKNVLISKALSVLKIESDYGMIVLLGIFVVCIYLLKNSIMLASNYTKTKFSTLTKKELSTEMFAFYLGRPYVYFLDINTADVIRGIGYDTDCTYSMLESIFLVVNAGVKIVLIGVYLFMEDALLTVVMLMVAMMMIIISVVILKPRLRRLGNEQCEAITLQSKWVIQSIQGIKDIKITGREQLFKDKYEKAYERRSKVELSNKLMNDLLYPVMEVCSVAGVIFAIIIRLSISVDIKAFITTCASFAMGLLRIMPSVSAIISSINSMVFAKPAVDAEYKRVLEARNSAAKPKSGEICEEKRITFNEKILLKNIFWKYPKSDKYILKNLNLEIQKGDSIALIGASGAGKTTLADVILGLLKPEEGKILIDGRDINEIPKQWCQLVGYVPQSVYLIDDTIRNNVLFGMKESDDEKIWSALEQAQLKPFVESLPQKLETIVGERGVKFSGGQRQRIAIARALYYSPEILVLDEATSALDTETETSVMEAIEMLQGKKTLIIVAHRLATIRKCNKIYEIADTNAIYKSHKEVFG